MTFSIGALSQLSAVLSFLALAVYVGRRYLRRDSDRALMIAAIVSALWALALTSQELWQQPPFLFRYLLELLRDTAWMGVLLALIRDSNRQNQVAQRVRVIAGTVISLVMISLLLTAISEYILQTTLLSGRTRVIAQITIALIGLSLVEQIWRNAVSYGRSSIKYLCIAIGGMYLYDFFLYADALLFNQISQPLWDARGFFNMLVVPLLAINMINARKQPVQLQLSRNIVFHISTLVLAGIYLLVMSAGGYYVRLWGGTWGKALEVLFISGFLLFFALLISSSRVRARLMLLISKNFFDYKYDYREEWLRMTQAFSHLDEPPPLEERAIRILGGLVESQKGALWLRNDEGHYQLETLVDMQPPKHTVIDRDSELARFFETREWIIDLREYQQDPVRYNLLEIPDALMDFRNGWLIIPLYLADDLYGIVLMGQPFAPVELNWENYDLIRVVARQACNFLAQADTQARLSRAMQFEAVSKASAFMVHDLKTLIAQLSMLVKNAPKHRNNPAFIDDMIRTTEHAVTKMSNLVDHIRRPEQDETCETVDLTQLVAELVSVHSRQLPMPQFEELSMPLEVKGDAEQLRSVLGHLIQNAQDATGKDGEVSVTLKASQDNVVVFIQDTGCGMTDEFIKERLFTPFDSTKGLTGMGIGAYQAREYVRRLGGNIDVTSEVDVGSCFSVRLPLSRSQVENQGQPDEAAPDAGLKLDTGR